MPLRKTPVSELLKDPEAHLTTSDLRDLGFAEGARARIFQDLPIVVIPGYRRAMVKVADFRAYLERHTHPPEEG